MAVSRAFLREFLDEAERHLLAVEEAVHAISGEPYREEPLHEAFRAIHAFTGGACFLGLERPHRLARGVESALDALRVRSLACTPEQSGRLLDALARLRVLLAAQRSEGEVPGDDEEQITALRTAVNLALAQSDDYRPSTSTVVRLIKAEIAPPSDVFPADEPGKPALEPRIVTSARFHLPALAAIDRLVATLPGDWHDIGRHLGELGRHAAGWPTAACDRLVAMRRFGDRLETGQPEAAEAYAQLVLQAEALRAILAPPPGGAAMSDRPPGVEAGAPGAPDAAELDPGTMSFCSEATDLLGAIELVVNKPGEFDDEGIVAVAQAFRALGETAARLRMPWVQSVAYRLERDLAERHQTAETSPATQRVLATAGVDALRVLIRRVRGQGREAGRR